MKSCIFWDITLCRPLLIKRRFRRSCHLLPQGLSIIPTWSRQKTYFTTLKKEVTYPSETSVCFQKTTRHYIPEVRTLQQIHCSTIWIHFILRKGRTKNEILNSSVSIVTSLWYGQPKIRGSSLCKSKIFLFSPRCSYGSGPTQPNIRGTPGDILWDKAAGKWSWSLTSI
jgi:hypothetical protein